MFREDLPLIISLLTLLILFFLQGLTHSAMLKTDNPHPEFSASEKSETIENVAAQPLLLSPMNDSTVSESPH